VDNLADDATVQGSLLDGAVQGAEAVRSIVVTIRSLYDRQEHRFAGPYGANGFLEDYVAQVRGEPIGCVVLVTRNAAGKTQRVVANYRPRSSLLLTVAPAAQEVCRHPICRAIRQRVLKLTSLRPHAGEGICWRRLPKWPRAHVAPLAARFRFGMSLGLGGSRLGAFKFRGRRFLRGFHTGGVSLGLVLAGSGAVGHHQCSEGDQNHECSGREQNQNPIGVPKRLTHRQPPKHRLR